MSDAARGTADIRIGLLSALIMLVIQFLLGMAVNLFVTVPTHHPGANPPEYFSGVAQSVTWAVLHGPLLLIIHAAFGLLLVLSAIGLLLRAVGTRSRRTIWVTAVGGLAVL